MTKTKSKTSSKVLSIYKKNPKKSRPGVHAKTKTSKLKKSRNYKKRYRGQG
jgi:hypothetical protein